MTTRRTSAFIPSLLAAALLLSACGNAATAAPSAAPTPVSTFTPTDPCAPENLPEQVQVMHHRMREFDDAFALAATTTRDLLANSISELQRIRRDAEDARVPSCLVSLKELQLVHMNTVIQTMLAFMTGTDQEAVNQGLALARQIHNQYMLEMARALGMTPAVIATAPPEGTPVATSEGTASPTPNVPIVTNNGPAGVNLRTTASLDGQNVGALEVGASALALGRSADGYWIMVEVPGLPGQVAWIYAALVQLSGPSELLPIVNSLP